MSPYYGDNPHRNRYSVYLAYRRDGGAEIARVLRAELLLRQITAFLDVQDLPPEGRFRKQLLRRVAQARLVVVVLSRGALDRCWDAADVFAQELRRALTSGRKIVLVLVQGFNFPAHMPSDLAGLPEIQGLPYAHESVPTLVERIASTVQRGTKRRARSRKRWPSWPWLSRRLRAVRSVCLRLWRWVRTGKRGGGRR